MMASSELTRSLYIVQWDSTWKPESFLSLRMVLNLSLSMMSLFHSNICSLGTESYITFYKNKHVPLSLCLTTQLSTKLLSLHKIYHLRFPRYCKTLQMSFKSLKNFHHREKLITLLYYWTIQKWWIKDPIDYLSTRKMHWKNWLNICWHLRWLDLAWAHTLLQ